LLLRLLAVLRLLLLAVLRLLLLTVLRLLLLTVLRLLLAGLRLWVVLCGRRRRPATCTTATVFAPAPAPAASVRRWKWRLASFARCPGGEPCAVEHLCRGILTRHGARKQTLDGALDLAEGHAHTILHPEKHLCQCRGGHILVRDTRHHPQ
jgi:hypothetical protein